MDHHLKLAAIDIGSNSIHLAVVQAAPGQHLEILDREKEMVRLGAGTLRIHKLTKETINRAIAVLQRYKKISESNHANRIITIATAAVRESHNAGEFIDRVHKELGLDVQVLPGIEEARLIALAVSEVTDFNGRKALIIDIGGGSTEFIITDGTEPEFLRSVRLGAVRLTEKFVTTDPISAADRDRLITTIHGDLSRVASVIREIGFDFVVGTSGTIINLVEAVAHAESGDLPAAPHGFASFNQTITTDQLARMNENLGLMTAADRARIPKIEKQRADIIVAGGLLLETILREVGANSITSCDWSLREGVILDFLKKHHLRDHMYETIDLAESEPRHPHDVAPYISLSESGDVRARSVLSIARRYDYDKAHSHHIAKLANQIFDQTLAIHGMTDQERELLEYAAILHDIGYHIAHNNHHRHSLYLIKNSEMPGFTGNESAVIATVARYHRGSMPTGARDAKARREHEDYLSLSPQSQQTARRLAAILRIADGLDRSYQQKVDAVHSKVRGDQITFYLESNEDCELEIWAADRKAEWFRKLFRVSVNFERETPSTSLSEISQPIAATN